MSKRKGSLPPPEAPPTSETKPSSLNSGTSDHPSPLTNGIVPHSDEKVTPKQKRQSRLTRAFTSGSLRIRKTKKKVKNTARDDCVIEGPRMDTGLKRRTIIGGISEDGEDLWRLPGINDISAIKLKSPKPLLNPVSDSSLLGRELPPVPDQEKLPADSQEVLGKRELPPLPSPGEDVTHTPSISPSPPLPVSADAKSDVLEQQGKAQPSISTTNDDGGPTYYVNTPFLKDSSSAPSPIDVNTPSPADANPTDHEASASSSSTSDAGPTYVNTASLKDEMPLDVSALLPNDVNPVTPTSTKATSPSTPLRNGWSPDSIAMDTAEMLKHISMLPELPPPGSEEMDPNANNFRPLPKTPPNSDYNDEELSLVPSPVGNEAPMELRNGHAEAEQDHNESSLNVVGSGVKVHIDAAADASPELQAATAGNDVKDSSIISDSSLPPPAEQPSTEETEEDLRDYTIGEVVTTYSYALPARVRILQGYCSDSMEVNISTEDVYDVHSVKRTRNVILKDEDGMTHRVSVESPLKVGVIYNPKNNYNTSLNGCTYKNISEVTSLPSLPKVIAATVSVNTGEEKNSVSEGEVFVVKQVQRSMFKVKKGLRVYSLLTKSDKFLLDDCPGHFSTKPSLVKMGLHELLGEVPDIYPSHCVIYPTADCKSDFSGSLSRVVTLLECNTDTVVVVSDMSHLSDQELDEANALPIPLTSPNAFELLLDDDISTLVEVAVMKWTYPEEGKGAGEEEWEGDNPELNHLYDDTMELGLSSCEDLSRSQGQLGSNGGLHTSSVSVSAGSEGDHMYMNLKQKKQSALSLENLREKEKKFFEEDEDAGYDIVGLHLIGAKEPPGSSGPLQPAKDPVESLPFQNHGYSTVNLNHTSKKASPPTTKDVATHGTVNGIVVEAESDVTTDGGMIETLESRFKTLQDSKQSAEITKVHSMLEKLTAKLETVDSQLNTLSAPSKTTAKDSTDESSAKPKELEDGEENGRSAENCNREYLKSLDEQQVGKLMELMSLGQYCKKILSEHISGEILMECDDAILEEEIGVASRIHRIRIMKIISGKHSAKALLEKDC